jgi:hypothetical protein
VSPYRVFCFQSTKAQHQSTVHTSTHYSHTTQQKHQLINYNTTRTSTSDNKKGNQLHLITKWQTTKGTNQYNTSNNKNQKFSEAVQAQITTKQRPNQQNAKGTAQGKRVSWYQQPTTPGTSFRTEPEIFRNRKGTHKENSNSPIGQLTNTF